MKKLTEKQAMIIVISFAVLAIGIIVFWMVSKPTSGNVTETPVKTPITDAPQPSQAGEPSSPPSTPDEHIRIRQDIHKEADHQGDHHVPPYVSGVMYSMTEESIKQRILKQNKFLQGLVQSKNIYEATKGTASLAVEEKLKKLPDGTYQDNIAEDSSEANPLPMTVQPYQVKMGVMTDKGREIYFTIAYVDDDPRAPEGTWEVIDYSVKG